MSKLQFNQKDKSESEYNLKGLYRMKTSHINDTDFRRKDSPKKSQNINQQPELEDNKTAVTYSYI